MYMCPCVYVLLLVFCGVGGCFGPQSFSLCTQGSLLMRLRRPCIVLEIEPGPFYTGRWGHKKVKQINQGKRNQSQKQGVF